MIPGTSGTTSYYYVEDTGTRCYDNTYYITKTYQEVCKEEKEPFDPPVRVWIICVDELFEIILRKLIIIQIRGPPS